VAAGVAVRIAAGAIAAGAAAAAPRPVYVAPAPVYVAPAPVYVAPRCDVKRVVRYNNRGDKVVRTVRDCD
jgi:hypothetical protein